VTQLVDATSQKVAGSIPDGVIGIFYRHNPFGPTMALGSTQPLTEMSVILEINGDFIACCNIMALQKKTEEKLIMIYVL
jgi:hypothetical protein